MKLRAVLLSLAVVLSLAANVARAGGEKRHSCQKALARALEAVQAYGRGSITFLKAEIGAGPIGTKHVLTREVDEGEFIAFAAGESGVITGLEIRAQDGSGKELSKGAGVDTALVQNLSLDKKQTLKVEVEVTDTAEQGKQVGSFVVCLLTKKQPPEQNDFILDMAAKQVKEIEGEGYDVEYGLFDSLSKDKPWELARKLTGGAYRIDGVSDDQRVKDLDVQLKDGAGAVVAKDARTDTVASLKADAKAGEHKVAVTATWNEGETQALVGVIVAKKP